MIFIIAILSCFACVGKNNDTSDNVEDDKLSINIALLGDSMTWIGGDNQEKETGWSHYLHQKLPDANIISFARSGATWTNTPQTRGDINHYTAVLDDENVIYNQGLRLVHYKDEVTNFIPDYIIIFAGANDALFSDKRPGLFNLSEALDKNEDVSVLPSDATTLSSSIQLSCQLLQHKFPNSKIILVTPVQMGRILPDKIHRVSDVIESEGNKLGIKVLRADKRVRILHSEEKNKPYRNTYDGIHTNPAGARMIADFIVDNLQ